MNTKQILIQYALKFVGLPYIWGGNNPLQGFDCSGLVQEILSCAGLDPQGDQTAQMLYEVYAKKNWVSELDTGAVLFFGKSRYEISHVALAITKEIMIEAGGGNASTRTFKDAMEQNAFVRIRPIIKRGDLVAILMPKYRGD